MFATSLFRAFLVFALLCWSQSSRATSDGEGLGVPDLMPPGNLLLPNNFSEVQTWDYPSGLRVHFKAMPQVANVYISAVLPVGSSFDPPGREGLAHFVEHMVFTDHRGQTEEEIKRAILDRGGRRNATTSRYATRYYVDLPASQWEFGITWMHHLLTGHRFTAELVDAERKVVVLEKSRRQTSNNEWLDRAQQWLRGNKLLVKKEFWERDLGLTREYRSVMGTYDSLRNIDLNDIQQFYNQHYGPQNFTLMIVGNVSRETVKNLLDRTFGTWQPSGEAVNPNQTAYRGLFKQRVSFGNVKNVDHTIRYPLISPTQYDVEMAHFSARFLRHLLNQRLRLESKATYGVSVTVDAFAGHAVLGITGNYHKDTMATVDRVIQGVLKELKAGRLSSLEFASYRDRVVSDLYMGYQTATSIANWCDVHALCDKQIYQSFPDRIRHWQRLNQSEFSVWLSSNLRDSRKVVEITRPYPASLWVEILGPLLLTFGLFHVLRRRWQKPVNMTEIRYVSKIRYPLTLVAAMAVVLAIVLFASVAIGFDGYDKVVTLRAAVDSYLLHWVVNSTMLALGAALILAVPAMIPRKLLLFPDGWRLKFWSFRSVAYAYQDLREVRECSFFSLLFSRRVFTTLFLHWGIFREGVYVRVGDRFGYFLRARDNGELMGQLRGGQLTVNR